MDKRQKMVQQWYLDEEIKMIQQLHRIYSEALKDINRNIEKQMKRFDPETGDLPQSAIYQIKYQQMLKGQIEDVLNKLQTSQYLLMSDYLDDCYENGFVGSIFDMHGQGVPMMMPIDRNAMVQAITLDSKISKGLYTRLGEDIASLKQKIASEVSRSILNGTSYAETARQLANITRIGYNNAIRITRTEGHRIQVTATMDAMEAAKEQGADVVKQWDSTLDGRTRPSHRRVDGEIRELDESFSNGLKHPGDPEGRAAEVINCRCALLEQARWAVDSGFTKRNNFTGELETFDTPDDYAKFKKDFFSKENVEYMNHVRQMQDKHGTSDFRKVLEQMTDQEYKHYTKLLNDNPVYNVKPKTVKLTLEMTADEVDKVGRHILYERWEEYRQKFLGNAAEVDFDKLDSSFMYDKVKLGRYKDREVVERIFTQVDDLSSKFYSPLQKMSWMDGTESAFNSAFATSSHGWGYGSAEIRFNPRKLTSDGIERLFELSQRGYSVRYPSGNEIEYLVTHEFGHCILNIGETLPSKAKNFVQCDFSSVKKARKELESIWNSYLSKVKELTEAHKAISDPLNSRMIFEGIPPTPEERKLLDDAKMNLDAVKISEYSLANADEFVAEAFADAVVGENPSEYSKLVYDVILKYFGKG